MNRDDLDFSEDVVPEDHSIVVRGRRPVKKPKKKKKKKKAKVVKAQPKTGGLKVRKDPGFGTKKPAAKPKAKKPIAKKPVKQEDISTLGVRQDPDMVKEQSQPIVKTVKPSRANEFDPADVTESDKKKL